MAEVHLTDAQKARLRKAVESRGLKPVADELGLAPQTVANLIGGLPVQHGSVLVARANIGKVRA